MLLLLQYNAFSMFETSDTNRFAGDILQFVIPAASLGIAGCKKDSQGAVQLAKTMVTNQVATEVLKRSLNNVTVGGARLGERPDGGDKNFPSGHTSASFAGAWQIQKRYGVKYAAVPLVMASFVGYSRVDAKRHTVAGVLAGGLVGIASAEFFTTKIHNNNVSLALNYNGYNGGSLTFRVKL